MLASYSCLPQDKTINKQNKPKQIQSIKTVKKCGLLSNLKFKQNANR
jgi:hypothetical protein